ncbi:tryptophan transporter [Lederbergia citrea]|uniref:Tryptophan transporter n=1 Tax=Lederbergia citrea TaxID=2833581 RepID=A0A942UM81_9BACI|nr:tryptophan transporter [Lederbergia citrea]MBS4177504.1 tryptophan transporter [Lederbergia citrea]MBS4204177.1 tryptophan transporter [Lederbergia citrea]MBS4221238.1 tryptophan transporter [Lederbergia citrea]
MNTRTLVSLSLLLGIGTALHFIIPPIMGIKPDMMLSMMFLGIVLFPEKKNVLLLGIVTGLLTALTTGFPMGQIPNMIDKPITAFVFFGLYLLIVKKIPHIAGVTILTALCTIVSGVLFLGTASIFFELPGGASFIGLFTVAVLPATILNGLVMFILYPVVKTILKRTNLIEPAQS